MRGKANKTPFETDSVGITPACAGKRVHHESVRGARQDHPRVCGEKGSSLHTTSVSPGSPPRVRGKEKKGFGGFVNTRITPACAGKSRSRKSKGIISKDHPRVCGEKVKTQSDFCGMVGSPPRVRGKVENRIYLTDPLGITPACAGKSEVGEQSGQTTPDHPRVCGEKSHCSISSLSVTGSPPRVRGKGVPSTTPRTPPRITPACAGKRPYIKRIYSCV